MQTLYAVNNPFKASENIQKILAYDGTLIFSDVFSHKIHRIPNDYWRFTYDAHKILFEKINFIDSKTKVGITRQNLLLNYSIPFPEILKYQKHYKENYIAFFLRKIIRKLFPDSFLNIFRLLPEISIFSIGLKDNK